MFIRETSPDGKISFWTIRPEANRCLTLDQVYKVSTTDFLSLFYHSSALIMKEPLRPNYIKKKIVSLFIILYIDTIIHDGRRNFVSHDMNSVSFSTQTREIVLEKIPNAVTAMFHIQCFQMYFCFSVFRFLWFSSFSFRIFPNSLVVTQ